MWTSVADTMDACGCLWDKTGMNVPESFLRSFLSSSASNANGWPCDVSNLSITGNIYQKQRDWLNRKAKKFIPLLSTMHWKTRQRKKMIPYTFDSNVEKEEAQNNFKCVLVLMEVFVVIKIRKRIVTYHRCMNCGQP